MATPSPDTIELSAQDVIEALTEQRNNALNELARVTAALRVLQRRQANGAAQPELPFERPDGLPAQAHGH